MGTRAGVMYCFYKVYAFSVMAIIAAAPFVASATEIMATKEYVDLTTVAKHQGTQNQMLQVNSSGDLTLVTPSGVPTDGSALPITSNAVYDALSDKEDVSNKLDGASSGEKIGDIAAGPGAGQDQVMYPSAAAVKEYAVRKPTSAAAGQVLTYDTGANANSRPVAKYIQVPMATGDPATSSSNVTGVVSIWLQ